MAMTRVLVVIAVKEKQMLSHYVYEEGDQLFNLITTKCLPKKSNKETLRKNFFLKGQEKQSINHRLFEWPIDQIGLKIIPTWKCNLRCGHCFVLHKLTKQDRPPFDTDRLMGFLENIIETTDIKKFGISFIGGEAAIEADKCNEIYDRVANRLKDTDIKFHTTMTTNGTIWNKDVAELFNRLDTLVFSVDGNAATHNMQRKGLDVLQGKDLHKITLRNIKRAVLMGFVKKIRVQSSTNDDSFNKNTLTDFFKDVLSTGVPRSQITVGSTVPTKLNKLQTKLYKTYLSTYIYNRPCCKYRFGKEFVVDATGAVYCDYFIDAKSSVVGTLETPFTQILEKHKEIILNSMPVLNDDKCLSCPVIGACWGRCCNTEFLKPSSLCNQKELHNLCLQEASKENLTDRYRKQRSQYDNQRRI